MADEKFHFSRRYLLLVLVFVLALYVLLPQFGDFKQSWHLLSHPEASWTVLATILTGLTYLAAAGTYCLLAFKRLSYWRTVVFQLAAMFINRLLPGGIGALGANFAYLKKAGHTPAQAGTLVGVNNILGFLGHGILTLVVLAVYSGRSMSASDGDVSWQKFVQYGVLVLIIIVLLALVFGRRKFRTFVTDVSQQILSYRHRPGHLLAALLSSMSLTMCNVLCLYSCMWALGVHLSFFSVFLIFSFGVGAGTATPTPGGLGGYEAALVAGFVTYHVDSSTALAIALLYRLISYWLALAVGALAFVVSQRRGYI